MERENLKLLNDTKKLKMSNFYHVVVFPGSDHIAQKKYVISKLLKHFGIIQLCELLFMEVTFL